MLTISTEQYERMRGFFDVILPPMEIEQVSVRSIGQIADWGHLYLRAGEAYKHDRNGMKIRGQRAIAFVMDSGISPHRDLDDNRDPSLDTDYTKDRSPELHPHGTHVAGIVGAVDNQEGVIGVSPEMTLVDSRVLNSKGGGYNSWITQAIRDVADLELTGDHKGKIKVINASFGSPMPSNDVMDAVEYAMKKGVIIVAAAGNSGYNPNRRTDIFPARYPGVISVGSLAPDRDNNPSNQPISPFSSAGDSLDIAAPGSRVRSTIPDGYGVMSGTSMASPHVAGIVGLLATLHYGTYFSPGDPANAANAQKMLKRFATDLWKEGHDIRTGAGAPIVIDYLNDDPEPEPEPEPVPPEEPEPPSPEPPKKPFRKITSVIQGNLEWKRNEVDGRKPVICKVELSIGTDLYADEAIRKLENVEKRLFGRTMIHTPFDYDIRDLAASVGRFTDFFCEKMEGLNADIMVVQVDVEGLKLINRDKDIDR